MKISCPILISIFLLFAVSANCKQLPPNPQGIITALQPPATLDTNPVCAGSVIDIPFTSSGTYDALNVYYAELVDSIGHSAQIDTIASFISNQSYLSNPAYVNAGIPLTAKAGCRYYIRVIATTLNMASVEYGPFCIQHCDILTNNLESIHTCVQSCQKQPHGYSDTIAYKVHQYNHLVRYHSGNKFEVQLIQYNLYPPAFSVINTGLLGVVMDTVSGNMNLHIPCPDTLNMYGIIPGMYYARIIADSSSFPDSALGTLTYLSIGEPADSLYLSVTPSPGPYCSGNNIYITASPDDFSQGSIYTWSETDKKYGNYFFPGYHVDPIGLNLLGIDTFLVTCQENSYGCLGNKTTMPDSIIVIGAPNISKTGPPILCMSDTGTFSISFSNNINYKWRIDGPAYSDTSKNILKIRFDTTGVFRIVVVATNMCFSDSAVWLVYVRPDSLCLASVDNINAKQSIIVYPNPNNGIFTLVIPGEAKPVRTGYPGGQSQSNVEVYNVLGVKVFTQTLRSTQGDNFIDMNNQPNGIYLYRVIDKNSNLLGEGKLVIQK